MALTSYKRIFSPILLPVLWLGFLLPLQTTAQNVKEYTAVDSLAVGDTFDFTITLDRNQEYDQIIFPDTSNFGSAIEIRSRSQFKASAYKDSIRYRLQFFATSDTTLPALPVHLVQGTDTTTLYTNPIPIGFRSVLAEDDEAFRPFKPIYDFAAAWWPYILAFILVALAAYLLYRHFTKEEQEMREEPVFTAAPFTNPLKELRENIAALENAHPVSQQEFKEFYIDLGDAIRRYFEDLHKIPALESTSREILQKIDERAIDDKLIADTRAVLQEADMVKFAKFTPSEEQAGRAMEKAYNFLERAEQIDRSQVEHLQREHQTRVEEQRRRFQREQKTEEVES